MVSNVQTVRPTTLNQIIDVLHVERSYRAVRSARVRRSVANVQISMWWQTVANVGSVLTLSATAKFASQAANVCTVRRDTTWEQEIALAWDAATLCLTVSNAIMLTDVSCATTVSGWIKTVNVLFVQTWLKVVSSAMLTMTVKFALMAMSW